MKILRLKPLSRRTVLRGMAGGASAVIGLPLLEAMLDQHGEALADGSQLPLRFISWFWGNGVNLSRFTPPNQGPTYSLTDELQPLAGVRDYVSVITGFNNHCHPSNKITHHEGMVVFSGYNNQDVGQGQGFYSNAGGPTIDQVIADLDSVGGQTTVPSIQLGVSKGESPVDHGTTMHNLSHRGHLQPLPPQRNPQAVWTTLFDSFVPPDDPQGPLRTSVLDIVKGKIEKLNERLGANDRERLEAHLQGISQLETKIQALPPLCETPPMPSENNSEPLAVERIRAVSEAMHDLIVYTFACDLSRVASMLLVEGAGVHIFNDISHTGTHHDYSHSGAEQNNKFHDGVVFTMEQLAYLLEGLRNTPDGVLGGNLLDNTILYGSSDCAEGYTHSVNDQPMIVAGGGGGQLVNPGIHYRSSSGENHSDVLLTLLQCFDPTATEVGAADPYSNTPFLPIKAS